jgi:hypothetical protein
MSGRWLVGLWVALVGCGGVAAKNDGGRAPASGGESTRPGEPPEGRGGASSPPSPAAGGTAQGGAQTNPEPEDGLATFKDVVSEESFEGETFRGIWGTDDDLWLWGGLKPPASMPYPDPIPLTASCSADRYNAKTLLRRKTASGFELMPSPATTSLTSLHGSDAQNVWLVGLGGAVFQFDGATWHEHDIRSAEGLDFVEEPCWEISLSAVFALGPNDVWVVGYIYPSPGGGGLILHYDGVQWKRHLHDIPDSLYDVWAASASDVWTAGSSGLMYHYDGSSWQRVNSATQQYVYSLHGLAADDVWGAGNGSVALRFDGSDWSEVSPVVDYSERMALTGTQAQGVWALNRFSPLEVKGWRQEVQHWDGGAWQQVSFSTRQEDELADLFMTPSGQLWGVGSRVIRFR